MASVTPIDILRPVGDYRAFDMAVPLPFPDNQVGQRYRFVFRPSEPERQSGWWLSLYSVLGVTLVRSVRLTPSRDLIALARARLDGLPPGRIALACTADPGLADLSVPGLVTMTYELD